MKSKYKNPSTSKPATIVNILNPTSPVTNPPIWYTHNETTYASNV